MFFFLLQLHMLCKNIFDCVILYDISLILVLPSVPESQDALGINVSTNREVIEMLAAIDVGLFGAQQVDKLRCSVLVHGKAFHAAVRVVEAECRTVGAQACSVVAEHPCCIGNLGWPRCVEVVA